MVILSIGNSTLIIVNKDLLNTYTTLFPVSIISYYTSLTLLGGTFTVLIMLNFIPILLMYGGHLISVSLVSIFCWSQSIIDSTTTVNQYGSMWSLTTVILIVTDYFVIGMRVVTLTLRIIINVILGHTLVELLTGSGVPIIFIVEVFVYLIQTYVFMILTKSYLSN